jgi:hypothetical protein
LPGDALWLLAPLIVVGIVVAVLVAIGRAARGAGTAGRVRIVALPPGEAPRDIRRAWIGVELPTISGPANGGSAGVVGVLSHRAAGRCDGYAVDGARAVRILADSDPDAAAWWRRHAPHVLGYGYQLVFPADVCEPVG